MKKLVFIFTFSILPLCTYANGTLYHCPSLPEVIYTKGYFAADTNYNGLSVHWYSWKSFPQKKLTVKDHTLTVRENCVGGVCSVRCVYHANNDEMFFLETSYNYKSEDIGTGNWDDIDWCCEPMGATDCQFYLNAM